MADYGMSDEELEQMYQEVILDAAKNPHGRLAGGGQTPGLPGSEGDTAGGLDGQVTMQVEHEYCVPAESSQFNPTCGDHATIHVEVSDPDDGSARRIERIVWQGDGCSISQASLSIMVDLVEGKTVDEALALERDFRSLMESRGAGINDEKAEEALGDAVVFRGVSKYPMRIKCALLGWEGMKACLADALTRIDKAGGQLKARREQ